MQTDERITALEQRLDQYDALIGKLKAYARLTAAGRLFLKTIGAS